MPKNYKAIHNALINAFPTVGDLDRLSLYELGFPISNIARDSGTQDLVFRLIEWAKSHDSLHRLLSGALAQNPDNLQLQEIVAELKSTPSDGLSFVIAAMTRQEAESLFNKSIFDNDYVAPLQRKIWEEFEAALLQDEINITTLLDYYGAKRDLWKPYYWGQSIEDSKDIHTLIEDIVSKLNNQRDTISSPQLLHLDSASEAFFSENELEHATICEQLARSGFVLIVDVISLFHPHLYQILSESEIGRLLHVSIVVISPIGSRSRAVNQLIDKMFSSKHWNWKIPFTRFIENFDWRCEIGVGDTHTLRRWLFRVLPEAERFMLGNPVPPDLHDVLSTQTGGRSRLGIHQFFTTPRS
jgi:hypothetical protein